MCSADGKLDLYITNHYNHARNILLTFSLCDDGAPLARGSGCIRCPNYMRRPSVTSICYECAPDYITGGLESDQACNFACPSGFERPYGSTRCDLCASGTYYDSSVDRLSDTLSPRCLACAPGSSADGIVPALDGCYVRQRGPRTRQPARALGSACRAPSPARAWLTC